ncbi:Zn-ribbon domain-containing OB-fold protein [Azospirillum canadense]|uniref:Zn-ribbon domain-containing OB-fold protein n=1 Tax=Azospirillum canadense TaxID=403962 RepID=UPI0022272FFC|nr:OB-fold domain-containing protein [Azospirillum canadense]MCW2241566.1 putative OB-fold protein [Azospirillum canadense]
MTAHAYGDDWTSGVEAIVFETCDTCRSHWYFARNRCPACGAATVTRVPSRGEGTVCAVTSVSRAPAPELRAFVPYRVALIDLDEGVRVMGHAGDGVMIGNRVRGAYRRLGTVLVPFFTASGSLRDGPENSR